MWHMMEDTITALVRQCGVVTNVVAQLREMEDRLRGTVVDHFTTIRSQLVQLVALLLDVLASQVQNWYAIRNSQWPNIA